MAEIADASGEIELVPLAPLVTARRPEAPFRTLNVPGCHVQAEAFDAKNTRLLIGGSRSVSVLVRHTGEDGEVYEENETRLVGMLELWDVQLGTLSRRFEGLDHNVRACALSPDGRYALSGGNDQPLRQWDTETGACLLTYDGLRYGCRTCAFADDGALIAVTLCEVHVLSPSGEPLHVTPIPFDSSEGCSLSPEGRFLIGSISPSRPQRAGVWDVHTGERIMAAPLEGATFPPRAYALSAAGRLALALRPHFLGSVPEIWDVAAGGRVATLQGDSGYTRDCALSPDGEWALLAGDDGVRLWDVVTGSVVRDLYPSSGRHAASCTFSPDGALLAAAGYQDTVDLWAVTPSLRPLERHTGHVTVWAFSPDGTFAVSGSEDDSLRLWDLTSGKPVRIFSGHAGSVSDCALHPSGGRMVSAALDGTLRDWDLATGICQRVLTEHCGPIAACAFSPDGRYLLSSGMDGNLFLWDWESGEVLRTYTGNEMRSIYSATTFTPDGQSVVAATLWHVYIWPVERVRPSLEREAREAVALAFSPDERLLVVGDKNGGVQVWDLTTGECLHALDADAWSAKGLAFSADGSILVSLHRDGVLCLWDMETGAQRARWSAPSSPEGCWFSPDGAQLFVGDANGDVHQLVIRSAGA